MIADTYNDYIRAVEYNEYSENIKEYKESLRKEQECWDELLECRRGISRVMYGKLKRAYDIGTNQMIRTKLYQLKNQSQSLGLVSGEVWERALREDCTDKELLEYPGSDIAWNR